MKAINILGAAIVLGCNLIVSFTHTLALFRAAGLSGGMEIVAAIGVETTFITGALNIVVAHLRGVPPTRSATFAGLLGVSLVSWSNIMAGWPYGVIGIIVGLVFPSCMVVAKMMLSGEIVQSRQAARKRETNREEIAAQSPDPGVKREEIREEKRETTPSRSPAPGMDREENRETAPAPTPTDPGDREREKAAGEKKRESAAKRETAHTSPAEPKREKPATPAINKAGEQHRETDSPASSSPAPTNPGEPKREKESADTTPPAPADLSHLVEVAREIMEREGRPPGRRRLAEMTGASEWECRRALAALRKGA